VAVRNRRRSVGASVRAPSAANSVDKTVATSHCITGPLLGSSLVPECGPRLRNFHPEPPRLERRSAPGAGSGPPLTIQARYRHPGADRAQICRAGLRPRRRCIRLSDVLTRWKDARSRDQSRPPAREPGCRNRTRDRAVGWDGLSLSLQRPLQIPIPVETRSIVREKTAPAAHSIGFASFRTENGTSWSLVIFVVRNEPWRLRTSVCAPASLVALG
jgi:hypothetical protein